MIKNYLYIVKIFFDDIRSLMNEKLNKSKPKMNAYLSNKQNYTASNRLNKEWFIGKEHREYYDLSKNQFDSIEEDAFEN